MRRRWWNRARALTMVLGVPALLAGCPERQQGAQRGTGSAGARCERVGQQCKLGGGVLGVCYRAAPGSPDFECRPQH